MISADKVVFIFCLSIGCLWIGYEYGKQDYTCPKVDNYQPISSSSRSDGAYCTYVRSKGMSLKVVKL